MSVFSCFQKRRRFRLVPVHPLAVRERWRDRSEAQFFVETSKISAHENQWRSSGTLFLILPKFDIIVRLSVAAKMGKSQTLLKTSASDHVPKIKKFSCVFHAGFIQLWEYCRWSGHTASLFNLKTP
jgi:hypothetical protein